jgi:hypothetical protein
MTREQIQAWVDRTRAERHLPRHVEDAEVLSDLAHAITDPTRLPARVPAGATSRESDREREGT